MCRRLTGPLFVRFPTRRWSCSAFSKRVFCSAQAWLPEDCIRHGRTEVCTTILRRIQRVVITALDGQSRIGNVEDSLLFLMPHEAGCIPCVRTLYRQSERVQWLLTGNEAAAAANGRTIIRLFSFHHLTTLDPKGGPHVNADTATYVCTVIQPVVKRDGAVNDSPGGDASWNDDLARLAPCVFPSYMRAHAGHSREPINRFLNLCMLTLVASQTVPFLARDPVMFGAQLQSFIGEDAKTAKEASSLDTQEGGRVCEGF
ncbi:putative ATP-dependent DEAD/H RNA helicase [Trypanosoma cruzi]|uniref:Putative ATP-dependent DEAD/H RNA helicase n=1 Tax=Trypanosoma cruzi TaxID=5693 RepID=A0A2V2V288_TRYCR|nr:putative ATP-dependent DEAD/H RNA helicase [Trypanosoma cruzi]